MADVYAVKSGNWSDTTLWNTSSLPAVIDDVYANTFTVYVDGDYQVSSVRNLSATSITRGGSFILNDGISLSANVIGGGVDNVFCVRFLSAAPAFANITGNVSTSGSLVNVRQSYALELSGTGTLTVYGSAINAFNNQSGTGVSDGYINVNAPGILNFFGDVYAGNGNVFYGIANNSTGIVNVVGNVFGKTFDGFVSCGGIKNTTTGTINVTGNIRGGPANSAYGIENTSTGTVNVRGDVIGGGGDPSYTNNYGILNNSSGLVTIIGNVSGTPFSTGAIGILNNTGTVNITGNVVAPNRGSLFNTGAVNIVGNVIGGPNICLSNAGPSAVNIFGNVFGGNASGASGINNTSTGRINVVGTVTGGSTTNCHGIGNSQTSTGTISLTGNCIGGTGGDCAGVVNFSDFAVVNIFGTVFGGTGGLGAYVFRNGAMNVYGNVVGTANRGIQVGGAAASGPLNVFGSVFAINAQGVFNSSTTGVVTITGDVFGGNVTNAYGVQNGLATSVTIVSGRAIAGIGSAAYGAYNASTGILRVKRAVGNGWGLGYTTAVASVPGVFSNVQGSQTFVEELECGPRGQWPTGGVIFFTPNTKATFQFETDTFQNYSLIQSNSADNLVPPVSSVRQGEVYDLGLDIGTCIIPPVSSVAVNTLVDNLTGTAVLTPQITWNFPVTAADVNSVGGRLRNALNSSAAENLINSFSP